jgi:hypothetical protein
VTPWEAKACDARNVERAARLVMAERAAARRAGRALKWEALRHALACVRDAEEEVIHAARLIVRHNAEGNNA